MLTPVADPLRFLQGWFFTDVVDMMRFRFSRGPGTTFEFALKIVELLAGDEVATSVRKALLL